MLQLSFVRPSASLTEYAFCDIPIHEVFTALWYDALPRFQEIFTGRTAAGSLPTRIVRRLL